MSLFPAYSGNIAPLSDDKIQDVRTEGSSDWLSNSSFPALVPSQKLTVIISSDSSSDESASKIPSSETHKLHDAISFVEKKHINEEKKSRHARRHKKEKRKHTNDSKRVKLGYEKDVENVYFEDRHRDRGNHNVNTLHSRVRAHYNIGKHSLGFVFHKYKVKESFQRYHVKNIDCIKVPKKDTVIKKEATKSTISQDESLPPWCTNLEEEQKNKARQYNENLTKEPYNIQLWIEYSHFQDTLAKFQSNRLITEDIERSTLTKKLSIIDRALERNTDSVELLKLKLRFMEELTPADQFSNDIEALISKDSGNVLLWKALIMANQGSTALCTVSKVLDLYSRCICTLRQRARTNPRIFDKCLLEMLYQCLIFLRHTGLWEQMWETIRLNLNLNLNLNKESLVFQGSIDEKKLIGMEEVILMSRLPLNQLWLRIESLRENCHWTSVSRDELELVGDSRRFILPEDVADFVHPIISHDLNFQMAIYSLLALKVPLLPARNFTLQDLALKGFEWGIDSSEMLLVFAYPSVGEMAGHEERKELLKGILEGRLTSGPQYLQLHPAQEPYLDFLREVFRTIAENLPSSHRTSIYVWWLRFERLLVFFSKNDPMKSDNKWKKTKTMLKEFLKKDENRNNMHFYREYALIEREMGKFDSCINILETTIQSQSTCLSLITNTDERAALFSVYRTLFETLLDSRTYKDTHKDRLLNAVEQMLPRINDNQMLFVEEYLQNCVDKLLQESPAEHDTNILFLPNLACDTITCYTYFLYIRNRGMDKIITTLRKCIEHFKEQYPLQELLYESEICILQLHYEKTKEMDGILKEELNNALRLHPDNHYLLSVFASIKSEVPTWKLHDATDKLRLWRAIAICLANRKRINFLTSTGDTDAAVAAVNKLLSFHRILSKVPEIRRCPLLWRMYMLLLREQNLCEKKGEEVYHQTITHCPWARSVYIDAAEVAPQLLTQIQDVIREKDLRMHVTPEELNILRG